MIFFLEDYCVVDENPCEPGQIYCSEKCRELDSQPPSLEYSTSSSSDSIYSNTPSFEFDDDVLNTPHCQHHFLYDSKINSNNNNNKNGEKCNCNKKDKETNFFDLDFQLNNSYDLKKFDTNMQSAKLDIMPSTISLMGILSREANSFEKELQENKHIKNSFKTAKDNYRLWLQATK